METKNLANSVKKSVKKVARKANPKRIMRKIQEDRAMFSDFDVLADFYSSPVCC